MHYTTSSLRQGSLGDAAEKRSGPVRRTWRAMTVTGFAVGLMTLAACTSGGGGSPSASDGGGATGVPGTPKRGGEVVFVTSSVLSRLDPAQNTNYAFSPGNPMNAIFGNLVYQDPGDDTVKMGFLESLTASEGGSVWTEVLRPGLKFSDGTPFDAASIAFNIERDADPSVGSSFYGVAKDLTVKVVDPTTLTITLPKPNVQFDKIIAEQFAAVGSPTAIKDLGTNYSAKPVGPGPFMYKSAVTGQSLTLTRNPHYALFAENQPYLDQLTFQFIADYPHQAAALSSGSGQVALTSGQQGVNQLKAVGNANFIESKLGGGGNFLFNMRVAPFNDPIARRAITLALDRKAMGPAYAAETPYATNLFPEASPFYDAKNNWPMQDKVEAQKLFDQLAASGKALNFTLTTYATFPDSMNAANLMQSQLSEYKNVKMSINAEPTAKALADGPQHNFQMYPQGLYMVNPVPDASEAFRTDGSLNYEGWSNPRVDAAITDLYATTDQAQQKKNWDIVLTEFNEDNPMYFANQSVLGFASSKKLVGVHTIAYGFVAQWGEIGYSS